MRTTSERLRELDRLEPTELWQEIDRRTPGPERDAPSSPVRRLGVIVLALAIAGVAVGIPIWGLSNQGTQPAGPTDIPTDVSPTPPPPFDGPIRRGAVVELPADVLPGGVEVGAGAAWVGVTSERGSGDERLLRIDLSTNAIVADIPLDGSAWRDRMAATDDAIWIGSQGKVLRIDPSTNEVVETIELPQGTASALAADETAVWVTAIADRSDSGVENVGELVRIDPATNDVVARVDLGVETTGYEDQIEIGGGGVWVLGRKLVTQTAEDGGDLIRVDPTTNSIAARYPVDAFAMVVGQDEVWFQTVADGLFDGSDETWRWRKLDVATGQIGEPFELANADLLTDTSVWSARYDAQLDVRISHYDRESLRLIDEVQVSDSYYTDAAFDPDSGTIWVAALDGVHRFDVG